MKTRAAVPVIIYFVLAGVAGIAWLLRPASMRGDTRRAAASVAASAEVEKATTAPAAAAAASVAKIGEANTAAPDSPAKDFIGQEVPLALANLPAPDPAALLAAEQRRAAVMEGQRDEARRLYAAATTQAEQLQREKAAALAARAAVDGELTTTAAARDAAQREGTLWKLAGLAAVLLWLYVKFTRLSPGALATAVNDIRAGVHPITALDGVTTRLEQWLCSVMAHLQGNGQAAGPPAPIPAAPTGPPASTS